jgi:hypothetical protein
MTKATKAYDMWVFGRFLQRLGFCQSGDDICNEVSALIGRCLHEGDQLALLKL